MSTIQLRYGDARATIDLDGAWVTELATDDGDILYPRQERTDKSGARKLRGGMHVCVPNFGPGGSTDQQQHGFGRLKEWKLVGHDVSYASMILLGGDGSYQNLSSMLSFDIDERSLSVTLSLINRNEYPIHVAPGFHPYFNVGDNQAILDDETLNYDELIGTLFVEGNRHELEIGERHLSLYSEELGRWAVWTDQLGDYVCVEPTLSGNSFARAHPATDEMLAPDEQRTYTFTMSW